MKVLMYNKVRKTDDKNPFANSREHSGHFPQDSKSNNALMVALVVVEGFI